MGWNTTALDADARLHSIRYDVDLGNVEIVRKWTEIDAAQLKTLSDVKAAETTITDPKVDNVTYSGTFYGHIVSNEALPDRSTTLYQAMTKSGSNELVAVTGIDASHKETSTYKWQISLTEVATFKATYATSSAGIRRQFRVNRNNDNGTFDVVGIEILAISQTVAEYTSAQQSSQSVTESAVLNTTNAAALPISLETGKFKTRSVQRKPDDTSDITLRVGTVTDQSAITYESNSAQSSLSTLHTQADSAAAAPTLEVGKLKRTTNTPTDVGKYRTEVEVATVIDQTEISYEELASKSVASTLHTQNASALGVPAQEDGKIKRNTNVPTEAGKTRTTEEIISVVDQMETSYEDNAAETAQSVLHTEAMAAAATPVHEDGKIKTVSNTPTEAGYVKTVERTATVIDQTEDSYEVLAARTGQTTLHTQAATAVVLPAQEAGKIKRVRNTPTDAGKVRTEEDTTTVEDQTDVSYDDSAASTKLSTLHTEAVASLATPAHEDGKIKRNSNTPTESGKVRTVEEVLTVVDQTTISYEATSAKTAVSILHTQAAAALALPSVEAGIIKKNTSLPTEAGKYRTIEDATTVTDQTTTSKEEAGNESVTSILHTEAASALPDPANTPGSIIRHSNTPTESGKVRTVQETHTAINQTTNSYAKDGAQEATTVLNTEAAAPVAEPVAPAAGTIVTVSNTPTPAGLTRTEQETKTSKELDTGWIEYTDRFGTSYFRKRTNADSVDVSELTNGTNNGVYVSKNEFQKYDYTLTRSAFKSTNDDWDNYTKTGLTRTERQFGTFDGIRYYCDVVITFNIRQTRSAAVAYIYSDGGLDGSGVRLFGSDYYRATNVTAIGYEAAWANWLPVPTP